MELIVITLKISGNQISSNLIILIYLISSVFLPLQLIQVISSLMNIIILFIS